MKLYKDIIVDLCKPYPLVVMHVPQYNTAWGARVTLVADGQIIVPDKETINAYIKKIDGEVVYASCTLSGEKILVSFDEQATAVPGPLEVELQLISNGDNLTSPIYQMVVDKTNIDYAMLTSTSEFGALLDALDKVNGLTVIDPANAIADDIGKPADAYYTGQALETMDAAITQQNENIANNYYKKTEVDTKISESKTSLKVIPLIFANTTFAANAQTEATRAISYADIPAGYTAVTAIPMNSGSADLTWNVCNISGGTDVLIRLRNVGATVVAAPRVNLLCIKS